MRTAKHFAALACVAGACIAPADAQPAAPSMAGQTITIYSGVGAGGGYDAYGRMVARNIGRHIPGNPTVIAGNMPGGGGRKLGNYIYNAAPKDGSAIGIIQHTTIYDAVFGEPGVHYDAARFNWLGSMADVTFVAFAWGTTGVKTIDDARTKQISLGATGTGATSFQYPTLLNRMFGTRFKIITGYKGSADVYHAVEQRELDGTGGLAWDALRNGYGRWISGHKINILVQFALKRNPQLPNVPTIMELARSPREKQVLQFIFSGLQFARPFLAPPGTPRAVVDMLRKAMTEVARDPGLLEEARRRRFDINPVDGATVQRMVADIYAAPQAIKDEAQRLLAPPGRSR
jgi:tripartite-type tricarboxylate transporter receptor subunit TctC